MLKTKINHKVKTFECGPESNIRINNMLLLLQEAAHTSADILGFGYGDLVKYNRVWVLSNLKLEIKKLPVWRSEIEIQTWPAGFNRLFASRDFVVNDTEGNRLINATSDWLVIDIESRRPFNITEFEKPLPELDERAIDGTLNRLNPKRIQGAEKISEVKVPYSSIDENRHVNNSEYVKWAFDALRAKNIKLNSIKTLQITYIAESFENEICEIFFLAEKNELYIYGCKADSDEYVFAMKAEGDTE